MMNNYFEEFEGIFEDASNKFESKSSKYGDSWKYMSHKQLYDRLMQEIEAEIKNDELVTIQINGKVSQGRIY